MIMEQLKSETKEAHQSLEKLLIPFIKQTKSTEAYSKLLEMFYGYMKPVEDLIDNNVDAAKVPMYSQRRKAQTLIDDLQHWDNNTTPELSTELPTITNHNQAIGAMYVFEGSTLGGKVINKILMTNLGKEDAAGFSFYNGYGDHTHAMWGAFTEALNKAEMDEQARLEIVAAANDTFTQFENWAAKTLVPTKATENAE
ncbi:MAG: hypothetical protein EOP51_15220 [Sphingobacteriales bacterium]|nr:MAG: hypothetical protein EOP51_15220 [Sphingobacteriales bacterium]